MNTWQVAQQIRHLLRRAEWDTDVPVFQRGGVRVVVTVDVKSIATIPHPGALIQVQGARADREEPDIWEQNLTVTILSVGPGDPYGETVLVGANRSSNLDPQGRGLLEIEEKMMDAISLVNDIDGVSIVSTVRGAVRQVQHSSVGYVIWRPYDFVCKVTADRYYHPATNFRNSGDVLSWNLPPDRWDRLAMVLRRASGSTPPAGPTDGTEVVLPEALPTSVTDSPGPGTWSYSLFAAYDETDADAAQRYSASVTLTRVVS